MKSLIVYFSRADENWFGGKLATIKKGNTEIVAEQIAKQTGADLFKVETVKKYPAGYYACCDEAKKEVEGNERPAILKTPNIGGYDNIFIGYPIWWGTMPMAMFTALENQDFKGKNVFPFSTNEGSGLGHSESDIQRICKGANIKKGLAIIGSNATKADKTIKSWLDNCLKA